MIHRDIKPDNVLLSSDGRVVVADFGVAAVAVAEGELSGTPAYMAPEQALGEPPTPAVDVYSVGVMLHEMLTGRAAFSGSALKILADKMTIERIGTMPGELPAELAEVIGRATAREPALRVPTAGALHRALEPWAKLARARTASVAPPLRDERIPDITTVIVVAPIGERSPRFYLAEAVHEEVVTKLGRIPRLRPQPRANAEREPGDVVVTFAAGDRLDVVIEHRGARVAQLSVPLAIQQIELAATAVTDAVVGAISLSTIEANESRIDNALDLMFRARHVAIREMGNVQEAMAMLNKAQAEAPNNPKIAAMLAISQVRLAFFMGNLDPQVLARAGELARQAVAAAPDQVLAHLAMGHYELMTGDSAVAAGHFRVAIACAPHSAEAHEQLGRMLLEAGYIEQAIERLEDAIAISPNVRTARWEIARAYALEQRWDDNARLVAELRAMGVDRPIARARYAWWRRDIPTLMELREQFSGVQQLFMPGFMEEFIATFVDGDWPLRKRNLLTVAAVATEEPAPARVRRPDDRRGCRVLERCAHRARVHRVRDRRGPVRSSLARSLPAPRGGSQGTRARTAARADQEARRCDPRCAVRRSPHRGLRDRDRGLALEPAPRVDDDAARASPTDDDSRQLELIERRIEIDDEVRGPAQDHREPLAVRLGIAGARGDDRAGEYLRIDRAQRGRGRRRPGR